MTHSALRATRSDEDMADSMAKHFRSALGISDKHKDDRGGHVVVWEGGPCGLFTMLRERMSVNSWCERTEELRHFDGTSRNPHQSSSQAQKEGGLHARAVNNEDFGTRPSRLLGEPAPRTEAACRGLQKVNRNQKSKVATVRLHKRFDESWFLTQQRGKTPRSIPERSMTRHVFADLMGCFAHFPPVTERHNMTT